MDLTTDKRIPCKYCGKIMLPGDEVIIADGRDNLSTQVAIMCKECFKIFKDDSWTIINNGGLK